MSAQRAMVAEMGAQQPIPTFVRAQTIRALVVDDDTRITELFSTALEGAGYVVNSAFTGHDALDLAARAVFDVALIDVFLPDIHGFDLLRKLRAAHPELDVIMITGQGDSDMARMAVMAGACDFVTKPCRVSELPIIVERNLTRSSLTSRSARSFQKALEVSYEVVLAALLAALDTRDTETEGHSERVTAYTMVLAQQMGISQDELYHIERGALLHDIGKIGVPDRILLKQGSLTDAEWVEMRKHPAIGFRMCSKIDFLKGAAQIVLHHHERWDGAGYPDGLVGETIPLGARIFAVVDTFDALTSERPYRLATDYDSACAEIRSHTGTQFDPAVVEAFLRIPAERWEAARGTTVL